jgi:DNA-binding LytR/AlgR family response regulator
LVFLDVQMPVINGIDFLKSAPYEPMVIITTAYPSYALEGYQLDVMDYLVKPITFRRFLSAVNKARDYHQLRSLQNSADGTRPEETDYFFVKCGHRYERIYFAEILFIEALQNYVTIYTSKEKYITLLNLKSVEEKLDNKIFMRVHKSYIVSIPKIDSIESNDIFIQKYQIPISRQFREDVIEKVVNDKLWKK